MTEENDLICPITLEIFRDPVKAKDGHIYERIAIEKWISEHGTSPITRERLNINELISENELKKICLEKRKLSVSYNVNDDQITFSSLNNFIPNTNRINPINNDQISQSNFNLTNRSNTFCILILLTSFILPISFLIGIFQGLNNSFIQEKQITTRYSNTLQINDTTYNQSGIYYYKLIEIIILTDGFYGLEIQSQSIISIDGFIYKDSFNSTDLSLNLISLIYKDKKYSRTYLGNYFFQSNKYLFMITTYFCCQYGPFQILITGPNYVDFI